MKTNMRFAALENLTALTLLLVASATAYGGLTVVETKTDKGTITTYKMTVTPAPEPVPALKHRLMLREIDLKQGNAAPYYYRALLNIFSDEKAAEDKFGDDLYKWIGSDVPLDKLPLEKVREAAKIWTGSMMRDLRTAAGRRRCDWQWNIEELRESEFISFWLEEIQRSRGMTRGLMLRMRLALAEGRLDDALDCLRINFRLARDVAKQPLLVCDLVGIAIGGIGQCGMIEFIAQPNSPNLYWALTELPRPLVSMRNSIRVEMAMGLRTFPFLLDAETASHSPGEWARLLAKAVADAHILFRVIGDGTLAVPKAEPVAAQATAAGLSILVYPGAKRRLIDAGMSQERVEEMPVGQVLAIDARREYRRVADDLEKWYYVPYRVARERKPQFPFHHSSQASRALLTGGYGYAVAAMLIPAVQAARTAEQRLLWQTDGLRTVEAIRMHAAETGHLPKSLDEIRVVPVPENPVTGKTFEYRLEGKTGVLDLPFSDGFPGYALRFEITLAEAFK